jgi:polar amino acid transport system permease protein
MLAQLADEAPRFFTWFNMVFLGRAALNTLIVSLLGCSIGYAAGFLLATARLPQIAPRPVRSGAFLWVETLRRIPFLIVLMVVFFGFQFAGFEASLLVVATTAVALRMSALAAENVRGGYLSVNPRQWDAALGMNMSAWSALRRVVLPQSWRVILPPSTMHTVSMVKETSLVSQIGFLELTFAARMLNQRGFSALICYGSVLVLYFVVSWSFARVGRYAERRLVTEARQPRGSRLLATQGVG